MPRGAPLRDMGLAALFFLLATIVFTWPIAAHVTDGLGDVWDAKLNAWILHWDFHQAFRDPIRLYDANIFYPARYALAFSENLFGAALFAFPLYAAGVSTLAAYNVVFLLGMFLSAMAAWALARDSTGDPFASTVAGLVYAFCPWRLGHIPHVQFQWGAFLALSLLFLLRYLDGGRRRDAVLFGGSLAWNALCNVHYALFSGLLVALVLAYRGLVAGWSAFRPRLWGAALSVAAAAIVIVPFFLPYTTASRLYDMKRGYGEIDFYSGVWTAFLNPGIQNKTYAPLARKFGKPEGELFPGVAAVALAAMALARRREPQADSASRTVTKRRRRIARVLDLLIAAGLVVGIVSFSGRATLGPFKIGDHGRIAVVLTLLLVVRLAVAFPRRSTRADLGDFLLRMRIGTGPGLFLAIAVLGVVVALGTHTPYYRFLVQSFGALFRAIRGPSRGIVLFDLALGVLAAWGLSRCSRGRRWVIPVALLLVSLEYRAFPVEIGPVQRDPAPVYRWLADLSIPGAVIEWPFATDAEVEYEFRSTAHWKPLVNGYSGFAPPRYQELSAMFAEKPIRPEIWKKMAEAGACLLIVHPRAIPDESRGAYAGLLRAGIDDLRLKPITTFTDRDGSDLVFQFADCPSFDPRIAASEKEAAARRTREAVSDLVHSLHPPSR